MSRLLARDCMLSAAITAAFVGTLGCSEGRRPPTGSPSAPSPCSPIGAERCTQSAIEVCSQTGVWSVQETCPQGQRCEILPNLHCTADPTCTTGLSGGKCNDGSTCTAAEQCASGFCVSPGICRAGHCDDQRQSGDETGVDCGGSCPRCDGDPCSGPTDCTSGDCRSGRCADATCIDGTRNGRETGADCGGGECPPCGLGLSCVLPSDCQSGRCDQSRCAAPPAGCSDTIKNGAETDVDCGGVDCPPCPLERTCGQDHDCLSQTCDFGLCVRPSCQDRRLNQGESDVDCGGPCGPCRDGQRCRTPDECTTRACESGACCTQNACGQCGPVPVEVCNGSDDDCNNTVDDLPTEPACPSQLGVCRGATAICERQLICVAEGYSQREIACDGLDNNCDGRTDDVSCTDDGDPCTDDTCTGRSCHEALAEGTRCSADRMSICREYLGRTSCSLPSILCETTVSGATIYQPQIPGELPYPVTSCSCGSRALVYTVDGRTYSVDCSNNVDGCETFDGGALFVCW